MRATRQSKCLLWLGFLLATASVLVVTSSAGANHSVTELLSIGPDGGNGAIPANFQGASTDAKTVFFRTDESLVASDNDGAFDIYKRVGNTTTQESVGSQSGVGLDANWVANTPDASRLSFSTRDQLVPQDTDAGLDIYQRSGGTTTLFPTTAAAAAMTSAVDYQITGTSSDGTRTFFTTSQQLVATDSDSAQDVYQLSGGTLTLLSTGPGGGNGASTATFDGASSEGSHVFFHTDESLLASDTDSQIDIYDRSGGVTTLISVGPAGGNGAFPALFGGTSSDGSHVFFTTGESLVGFPDTDGGYDDVYDRSSGNTALISYGPNSFDGPYQASYAGNSPDGTRVWFHTPEALVSGDTNGVQDVYERSSAGLRWVSSGCGSGCGIAATFGGASADGSHVIFTSGADYGGGSCNGYNQVWDRTAGGTTRASDGVCGWFWTLRKLSADGSRILMTRCLGCETFERYAGTLYLITSSPSVFSSADAQRVIFHTTQPLIAADTDSSQDVYAISVAGSAPPSTAYARPKGATPLRLSLVPAYKQCTGPNATHAAPFSHPSCSPPEQISDYLTVGTLDANGQAAKSVGSIRMDVLLDNPGTTGVDEQDITLHGSMTDVRNKGDLSDYTGELQLSTVMRITDKLNGTAPADGGTVEDFPYTITIPCTPTTTDTTIGSSCSVDTTENALISSSVVAGKRAIQHLGDVNVYDGGSDGDVDTSGNTLFAWQGLFSP